MPRQSAPPPPPHESTNGGESAWAERVAGAALGGSLSLLSILLAILAFLVQRVSDFNWDWALAEKEIVVLFVLVLAVLLCGICALASIFCLWSTSAISRVFATTLIVGPLSATVLLAFGTVVVWIFLSLPDV